SKAEATVKCVRFVASFLPVGRVTIEVGSFDTQKMQNPDITHLEYQQGELQGYFLREYVLEKWQRKCAYCDAKALPLEIEHIVPRSRGGTNRVSNLVRRFIHHFIPVADGKGQEGNLWVNSLTS